MTDDGGKPESRPVLGVKRDGGRSLSRRVGQHEDQSASLMACNDEQLTRSAAPTGAASGQPGCRRPGPGAGKL